jgi:ParB/RepB/Spo0J family partition protein
MTTRPIVDPTPGHDIRVVACPLDRIVPNEYNPNTMTPDAFAELVAEVRHLGRLPKPVVVRPHCDGWLIVDGEHGWRAAREAGLAKVPCEVVEADDFESMRQTFKRNQHGTHNQVRLGHMFRAMMANRRLSQRDLAQAINVSEGTIRNAVTFATAAEMRNGYAVAAGVAEDTDATMARLTVRQVRAYVALPAPIRDLWLDSGADLCALRRLRSSQCQTT